MTLADAYSVLKHGSLWSSTGKCKGYATANPGEARQIDAYVAALNAGTPVTPPVLQTDTGKGLVGMLAALAATAPIPTPPPPPAPTGLPLFGLDRLGGSLSGVTGLDRFGFIATDAVAIGALVSIPELALAYMSAPDSAPWFDNVSQSEAQQNGWLLEPETGPGEFLLDVGNTSYQQAAIVEIDAYLRAHIGPPNGKRGVYFDDVCCSPIGLVTAYPSKYPDAAHWWPAMLSFVQAVGPGLRKFGWVVWVNAIAYFPGNVGVFPGTNSDDGSSEAHWIGLLAPFVDGSLVENMLVASDGNRRGDAASWDNGWATWRKVVQIAEAAGISCSPTINVDTSDVSSIVYTQATFLLDTDGKHGGGMMQFGSGNPDSAAEWMQPVGDPVDPVGGVKVGVGWRRRWTLKTSYVNPSLTASQDFGGGIVLAPKTAAIR